MADLTLDEKTNYAVQRTREAEAERHFFGAAQPFFPLGFTVFQRNPGHWDVMAEEHPGRIAALRAVYPGQYDYAVEGGRERAFRIRGEPGRVIVMDERWDPHRPHPRQSMTFRSMLGAMSWIVEELMQEPEAAHD